MLLGKQAAKARAQSDLVRDSRLLLKRLSTEVEIREATDGFPVVRLPIEVGRLIIAPKVVKS